MNFWSPYIFSVGSFHGTWDRKALSVGRDAEEGSREPPGSPFAFVFEVVSAMCGIAGSI